MADPPERCDLAVVGAGIVGLAVARELARRHPGRSVVVLEGEDAVGVHQTGHNTGVIHAGIYYKPGSLKARLCVEGATAMYAFCEEHGVAHARLGKLIVASEPHELPALDELERRGQANGVPGLRRIDATEAQAIEPHVRALAALHSPATGVADFPAVARTLADQLRADGATVALGCPVVGVQANGRSLRLRHGRGELAARQAVFCAGAWADRLAVLAGAPADPRIVPFRGAYLRLRPERRALVRGLIYPVPDPALPFLGVHLSRRVDDDVLVGPTALLAPARDAYRLRTARRRDLGDTLRWPGTWRMARRFWRTGLTEIAHAASRRAFVAAARRFVPELRLEDVDESDYAGVRAQAVGHDGRLIDDFVFSVTDRALHVRNAPSPAATSAFAIAAHIADTADHAFGL